MWDGDLWWIAALHWADLCSDFSALHHIPREEIALMDGADFGSLAQRLVHYAGAVQAAALKAYRATDAPAAAVESAPSSPRAPEGVPVDPTDAEVQAMRDAARRRRFDPAKYGEHKYVDLDTFMREASRG